jgi:hypothetical protein
VDFYVNPRIANVRVVQYVTAAAAIGIAFLGASEGEVGLGLLLLTIGAACSVAFELFYIRRYVTRLSRDGSGWLMHTLSTIGERPVRFDPAQAQLGDEITQVVRYGAVNHHYPLYVGGTRYILDTTPPVQFDADAFRQALKN